MASSSPAASWIMPCRARTSFLAFAPSITRCHPPATGWAPRVPAKPAPRALVPPASTPSSMRCARPALHISKCRPVRRGCGRRCSRPPLLRADSELHSELAVEQIRAAATQGDRKCHEAPQQDVFVTACEPGKSSVPIETEDHEHLDCDRGCKEAREEAEKDAEPAQALDQETEPIV